MVENLKNKISHKWFLLFIKYLPAIIALCYFCNTLLSFFNINAVILSTLAGTSILTLIFMYLCSYIFKFCLYHRLFLHYILINDILNYLDYYFTLPISDRYLFCTYISITFVFIVLIVYSYVTISKESISKNNS